MTSAESLAKETLSIANATKIHLEEVLKSDSTQDPVGVSPSLRTSLRNPSPLFLSPQTDPGELVPWGAIPNTNFPEHVCFQFI